MLNKCYKTNRCTRAYFSNKNLFCLRILFVKVLLGNRFQNNKKLYSLKKRLIDLCGKSINKIKMVVS